MGKRLNNLSNQTIKTNATKIFYLSVILRIFTTNTNKKEEVSIDGDFSSDQRVYKFPIIKNKSLALQNKPLSRNRPILILEIFHIQPFLHPSGNSLVAA